MLVISRKKNEKIIIDPREIPMDAQGLIKIVIVDLRGDKARLGIEAPKGVPVHRQEVFEAIKRQKESKPCEGCSTTFDGDYSAVPASG
jgi:carbon storage regulator